MQRGYIRIRKNGPDEPTQKVALASAGVDVSDRLGCVYVDGMTKTNQRRKYVPDDPLPQRTWAIRHLRDGDELVIYDAATLGRSADDIIGVLAAISRRRATLSVIETGKTYSWHPDAADIAMMAKIGSDAIRRENTSNARKHAANMGLRGGRPKMSESIRKRAFELWSDPTIASAKEVSAILHRELKIKISVRALYNNLPSRGDAIDKGVQI